MDKTQNLTVTCIICALQEIYENKLISYEFKNNLIFFTTQNYPKNSVFNKLSLKKDSEAFKLIEQLEFELYLQDAKNGKRII